MASSDKNLRGGLTFERFGRAYHLRVRSAADLSRVCELDEAHWVAISAPINTLHMDRGFLEIIDTDKDGRIRPDELRHAIAWTLDVLQDHAGLEAGSSRLVLGAINTDHADGKRAREAARKMLDRLGGGAEAITLEQVRSIKGLEADRSVSETGVVLADAAEDEATARFITDIVKTLGGSGHPSGKAGVSGDDLTRFMELARGLLDWHERGKAPEVRPHDDKPEAFDNYVNLRDKLDLFFAQCKALQMDRSLSTRFSQNAAGRDLSDPSAIERMMREAPIAAPNAEGVLELSGPINPAYRDDVKCFAEWALDEPKDKLDEARWRAIKQAFAAREAWLAEKAGGALEALGLDALRDYLEGDYERRVRALIDRSGETAFVMDNVRTVETLVLYQANLMQLINNYVSFPSLYKRGERALFDYGDLIMDGRRFNLAVRVYDRQAHARIAETSRMAVLYLEVTGRGVGPYEVAVAVTSGGRGNLCVGKRGVFHDVEGRELDARVVAIIDNPISLREAVAAPFKRLGGAVMGKIESIGASAEKKLDKAGAEAVSEVRTAPDEKGAKPQAASGQLGGVLAGGGIAVAALGSSLAFITKTLAGLNGWQIAAGLGGAIAAVLLPTLVIAFVKLRSRDLSAMLEGSGWAINARMRLNRPQSRYFTERPGYPVGARGIRRNYAIWLIAVVIVAAVAWVGWDLWQKAQADNAPPPPGDKQPADSPETMKK